MAVQSKPTRTPLVTEPIVRDILTAYPVQSTQELAARFQLSTSTVRKILSGQGYTTMAPELARNIPEASCATCRFWTGTYRPRYARHGDVHRLCDLGLNDHHQVSNARRCGSYWAEDRDGF